VAAMRASRANGATTDSSAATECPARRAGASRVPGARTGPGRSSRQGSGGPSQGGWGSACGHGSCTPPPWPRPLRARSGQRRGVSRCWMGASTQRPLGSRPAHWRTQEPRTRAPRGRAVQGGPVQATAATAPPDHAGGRCAVALPPRRAVHPCWAWGNAAPRQTRTRQPRPSLWQSESMDAPRRAHLSWLPRGKAGRRSARRQSTSPRAPRSTLSIVRSTMVRARRLVGTRTGHGGTGTRWPAWGLVGARSWTASRVSANAFCPSASYATRACTTRGTCTGVRPSQQPCGPLSRPQGILGDGWPINIAVCR